jgi:hypothetical protein
LIAFDYLGLPSSSGEVHEQVRPQMEQACWACLNSYFVQRLVQAELDD